MFNYLYNALQPKEQLNAVVQSPGEQPRRVIFNATTAGPKHLDFSSSTIWNDYIHGRQQVDWVYEHRFKGLAGISIFGKFPSFDLTPGRINEIMDTAGKLKTLIIDLRGNPGGYVDTLLQRVGNFFDPYVKIGDRKPRKDTKSMIAKTRGHDTFAGQLILLVDSRSASCAELFARVVQIEKNGTVIGDLTDGAVMEARLYPFAVGETSMVSSDSWRLNFNVSTSTALSRPALRAMVITTSRLSCNPTGNTVQELKGLEIRSRQGYLEK